MNKKTKAAPGATNTRNGGQVKKPKAGLDPDGEKYNMDLSGLQIYPLLFAGEENALLARELACITGLGSRRVRALVEKERSRNVPILASSRGYFLPAPGEQGRKEMVRFSRTVIAKGRGSIKAAAPALRRLQIMYGQETLAECWAIEDDEESHS